MKFFKIFFTLLLLFLIKPFGSNAQTYKIKTIVIDAGHGGAKPGARGKYSWEKDVALKVALKQIGRAHV